MKDIDKYLISETKIYTIIPVSLNFYLNCYQCIRQDKNQLGGASVNIP